MGRPKIIQDRDLLEHARAVFLQQGATATTKEIAKRAGVSEATLFQRFPTKNALFLAALVPPVVEVEAILGSDEKGADPRETLAAISHRMLAYFHSLLPTVMHLMAHPSFSFSDITAHFPEMPAQAIAKSLAARLSLMRDRGEIRADHPQATANLLVSAIHSLAVFELMGGHGDHGLAGAVDPFVTVLWNGLEPQTPTSTRKRNSHEK